MKLAATPQDGMPSEPDEDNQANAFRKLCRFGPLLGAIWVGALTIVVDWFLPPPGSARGMWDADYPYMVSVAISVGLGAFAGGAFGESALYELSGRFELASETCFRWGIAGAILFILAPFSDFDYAVRHVPAQYLMIVRSYLPCIIAAFLLLSRGVGLARQASQSSPT